MLIRYFVVRDQEAAGSSPATPTKNPSAERLGDFSFVHTSLRMRLCRKRNSNTFHMGTERKGPSLPIEA